jgi:multidrug efflux pump subunit AcrA (membrane-fusion protein)
MFRKTGYSFLMLAIAGAAYVAGSVRAPRETVAAAPAPAARTLLHYHCPMHPDYKSSVPGTAPCCGMALEPVYEGPAATPETASETLPPGAIVVSAHQQQLIGVKVGTVEEASGTEHVRVFGRVTPEEPRVYKLSASLEAYISEMSSVTTGSYVRKGQWLASYSTPDARTPINALISAMNVYDREDKNRSANPDAAPAAKVGVAIAIDRLRTMGMSPSQIEEIGRTREATTTVRLTSPVDGFVLTRTVSTGQRFDAGAELFQIADLQRVWILADVPLGAATHVKPGTVATVKVPGRETPITARVSATVLPQFDPTTQSFKLRLEAENPGFVLRPDMFVDAEFEVPYDAAMLVPVDAVLQSGLSNHVFVERSAGVFEPRQVELGRRHAGRVAVLKGLAAGERIATSGTFLLDSESRMKSNDRSHH